MSFRHLRSLSRSAGAALLAATAVTALACTSTTPSDSPLLSAAAHTVVVSPASASGPAGASQTFSAELLDARGRILGGASFRWSSTDTSVVTVGADGVAHLLQPGAATVIATAAGRTGTATVSVTSQAQDTSVGSVAVSPNTASVLVGDTTRLAAVVKDTSGTVLSGRSVAWTSSNGSVASVSAAGLVTALAGGTATVTASAGGKRGSAAVTVSVPPPTVASVTVAPSSASLVAGTTQQLTATVKDGNGNVLNGQAVTWTTSAASVATVSAAGLVSAVAAGNATITAAAGGKSGAAAIAVTSPTPTVGSVTVTPTRDTLVVGGTVQLGAAVKDQNGNLLSGQAVTWSSSAPSVASVNASGLVTALAVGAATISATSGGKTGTAAITDTAAGTTPVGTTEPTVANTNGAVIWSDNFDSYSTDTQLFSPYVTLYPEAIHLDAAGGLGGSKATRIDWPAATSCTDYSPLLEKGFGATAEIYLTFSVRYTPNFQFDWTKTGGPCTGNAKKLFFLWAQSGSRWDFISENHSLGVGSDYDHPLFAQNVGTALTDEGLADGQWHRFTFHIKQSSTPTATDGFIYGWIDGQLRWSYPNIASNNSGGYYDFKLPTTFNQGSPVAQSEWLDNLTLWKP